MKQTIQFIVGLGLLAIAGVGLIAAGYQQGRRELDDLQGAYTRAEHTITNWEDIAAKEGWLYDGDDVLRVNVECRGNPSDWATIRMANQVGFEFDLPVFVHGNCETHEVVDALAQAIPSGSIQDNGANGEQFQGMNAQEVVISGGDVSCPGLTSHECADYVRDRFGFTIKGASYSDEDAYHEITNVPQPEGQ